MRSLTAKILSMVLLSSSVFVVGAHADDSADLIDLPSGSSISLPINQQLIDAQSTSLALPGMPVSQISSNPIIKCYLGFRPSSEDRTIQGQLTINNSARLPNDGYGGYTISGNYTLDGKIAALSMTCQSVDANQNFHQITVGQFRSYIASLKGTVHVTPPAPFGQ